MDGEQWPGALTAVAALLTAAAMGVALTSRNVREGKDRVRGARGVAVAALLTLSVVLFVVSLYLGWGPDSG